MISLLISWNPEVSEQQFSPRLWRQWLHHLRIQFVILSLFWLHFHYKQFKHVYTHVYTSKTLSLINCFCLIHKPRLCTVKDQTVLQKLLGKNFGFKGKWLFIKPLENFKLQFTLKFKEWQKLNINILISFFPLFSCKKQYNLYGFVYSKAYFNSISYVSILLYSFSELFIYSVPVLWFCTIFFNGVCYFISRSLITFKYFNLSVQVVTFFSSYCSGTEEVSRFSQIECLNVSSKHAWKKKCNCHIFSSKILK